MTQVTLAPLRTATADEATTWFAESDAEALVAAIRATPDAELRTLVAREEIRVPAVRGLLSRLQEYADEARLASTTGTVRIDLTRDDARLGHHLLRLGPDRIDVEVDVPASTPADVVLATTVVGFIRLVSGQGNAALDFLAGRLDVEGDADRALAVGGLVTVPGTHAVAVDPTALDPVEVARALAGVPTEHLRHVMADGFRPVVLGEIFRRLPSVEALGSTTVICTDKTRTLTSGDMSVVRVWTAETEFIAGDDASAIADPRFQHVLDVAIRASRQQAVHVEGPSVATRDPVDAAMFAAATRFGVDLAADDRALRRPGTILERAQADGHVLRGRRPNDRLCQRGTESRGRAERSGDHTVRRRTTRALIP